MAESIEIMEIALVEAGGLLTASISQGLNEYGYGQFGDVLVRYDWAITDLDWVQDHTRWSVSAMRDQPTPSSGEEWQALVAHFRQTVPLEKP